nr:Helicase RNase D C terminal HRDC domain [Hymenolepis microstoma]
MTDQNDNLDQISKQLIAGLVPNAAKAVRLSREFPTISTPSFAYYRGDPKYNAVMNANSNKIESMIQNGFDMIDGNVNIMDLHKSKSLEEKFTSIVSANDRIIDRLNAAMDEEESEGVKKEEVSTNKERIAHPISELDTSRQSSFCSSDRKSLNLPNYVIRPQTLFTVKPDNSPTLFLPILKSKPNAIAALEDSQFVADPQTGDYDHPYFVELSEFENSLEDFEYVPAEFNPKPASLDVTPLVFVDSVESLEQMLSDLLTQSEIAVDLEHHSYRTYLGITCLIQISTRSTDYVVDALKLRGNLEHLNEVFTNPNIVKVLHGSDMDLMWLQRDFGVYMINLFDTGQASRVLHFARFSLSFLLEMFVGIVPDKSLQLADWRARPLSEELITYARSDTHYLLYVAEKLRAQLDENNLLMEVLKRSCRLCRRIYKKPRVNPLGYLEKSHGYFCKTLSKRQAYALKHLCLLRDSIGRSEDESNGFVLPNHMLHNIAERLPKEPNGLLACCNPIPIMVNKYLMDFHKVVMDAREGKHVEKEIDEDRAKFEAKIEEGVKFSSTTASHSAPHEKPIADKSIFVPHTHVQDPLQVFNIKSSSYPLYCIQECGHNVGWNNWYHQSLPYYPEQKYVVGLANYLAPIQVSNVVIDCENIRQHKATDFNHIEDPLYKPLEALSTEEFSPVKLTQAEEVEVAGLGAKFAAGRSAQSHAMTNLARKRQQRERNQQNKQQGASSKFNEPINIPDDDNEEDCVENDVVILRDLKIKKPPKGSSQPSPVNRQSVTPNSIDLTVDGASSTGSGSPESAHRSKIPKTPNNNHRQDSTPSRRGAHRGGRGRGGRNKSFSRSPATFSPQAQS